MASAIQITYLHHSGFAVRLGETLLVFDEAREDMGGEGTLDEGLLAPSFLKAHRQTVFFVSHSHADHFNPSIYTFADIPGVQYVLGFDIPPEYDGHRMQKGDHLALGGIDITAYGSTDEGVSFLVKAGGWTLFHAGDLNFWHWREESTHKEIDDAERNFIREVTPLQGETIDFAFFPLDPRMGQMYDAGALYFLMHIRPRVFLPMHWWDRDDAAITFARRNRTKYVEIVALTQPGKSIRAHKQADGAIHLEL